MPINLTERRQMEDLRGLRADEGILSMYLPSVPDAPSRDDIAARAMDLLRDLRNNAPDQLARIDEEASRILDFLRRDYVPHGTCVAIFSGAPSKTWEVISLQLPSPALARFGERPYLLPIDAFRDDFGSAVLAIVSQREARFLRLSLGEVQEANKLSTDVPGLQRQGGRAVERIEQDRLHHIDDHLRRVAAHLGELDTAGSFENLVLSGSNEVTDALIAHLPAHLQGKIAGRLHLEMFATSSDAAEAAWGAISAHERENEVKMVTRLVDMALAGGQAALGEDETLQMLREGRARSLVVAAETAFHGAGETAFQLASTNHLPVEIVHDEAAGLLRPYAGLAAELRF